MSCRGAPPATSSGRLTIFWACLIVTLIWAGIYLPALGSVQLEHEEPRRALPALHMLASGDWLVPRVGASPYLSKPPLLNWLIALSFKFSGGKSEWAVRLPSVAATLALAISAAVVGGRSWLGTEGGLLAAIFVLTNFTMIESGRLAEIEALYTSLSGIALVLWMTSWHRGLNRWRLWLSPAPFLALAMLAKGPTHLFFFYGIAVPVLVLGKDLAALRHPAHWLALVLVFGGLFAWAIPSSIAIGSNHPAEVWRVWWSQIGSRMSASPGEHFHFRTWLLNWPQTLKNFLPWTLLLPLLWRREITNQLDASKDLNPRGEPLFRGARWGMVFSTVVMSLLPNGSPRYIYPLLIVPCLLLGRALTVSGGAACPWWLAPVWKRLNLGLLGIVGAAILVVPFLTPGGLRLLLYTLMAGVLALAAILYSVWSRAPETSQSHLPPAVSGFLQPALTTAVVAVLAMAVYSLAVVPRIDAFQGNRAREVAASIRSAIPADAELWVQESIYQPFWYYLEPKVRYFQAISELPWQARYVLLPASQAAMFAKKGGPWHGAPPVVKKEITDNEGKKFVLFQR
jgi:4-amino-4-deoxy-L-arabinose transferase-like glycosyltransferase